MSAAPVVSSGREAEATVVKVELLLGVDRLLDHTLPVLVHPVFEGCFIAGIGWVEDESDGVYVLFRISVPSRSSSSWMAG